MKAPLSALALLLLSTPALAGPPKKAQPPEAKKEGELLLRGEKLKGLPLVALAELLKSPQSYQGKTIGLEGKIRKNCQKMGCWMELADSEKAAGVRVIFKGHSFFVPLDSAGKRVKVEGEVQVVELSAEEADHFKQEGGQIEQDAAGKPREVQLVAYGVELGAVAKK